MAVKKKPRIGRPPSADSMDGRLFIRLGEQTLAALADWANEENQSTAGKARELIERALARAARLNKH